MRYYQTYNNSSPYNFYKLYANTFANDQCRIRLQRIGGAFEAVEKTTYPTHLALSNLCTVHHKITHPTTCVFIAVVYITDDETKGVRQLTTH